MRSISPVIHSESSEAKNTAAGAMSSVSPTRPSGVWDSNIFRMSLSWNPRSEEHTSELQSRVDLVCRLLLEKKKTNHSDERQRQISSRPPPRCWIQASAV